VVRRGDRSTRFPNRPQALDWLDTEHPTLVAAVTLAHQTDRYEYARDLSLALAGFLALRKHSGDWISTHELARDATRRLGDRHGEGVTLHGLGCAYHQLRQFNDAVIHYQQARRIRRELGDRHGECEILTSLGLTYAYVRRFDDAITCHQAALHIFRELDDRHGETFARVSLGLAHGQLRHYDDAVHHLEQALDISREHGDRHREALVLANLGNTYFGMCQFDKAITRYRQALDIQQELEGNHGAGVIPHGAYRDVGQVEQARDCWEQALAIFAGLSGQGAAHDVGPVLAARRIRTAVGRWATSVWRQVRSRSPSTEPGGG
jgi:tetratricopeptide (TPR) repeat protein